MQHDLISQATTPASTIIARLRAFLGSLGAAEPLPLNPHLQRDAGLIDALPPANRVGETVERQLLRGI